MTSDRPHSLTGWLPDLHGSEFLNITSDLFLIVSHADDQIAYANHAAAAALGYDEPGALIGLALADIMAHNGSDITRDMLIAMAASAEKMILRLVARNGDRITTGLIAAHERVGRTYIILRRIEDTADVCAQCGKLLAAETRAESALQFMRSVLEQAPIGVVMLDQNLNVRWMNQYVRGHTHWGLDQVVGVSVESITPAKRAQFRRGIFEYALREDGVLKASFMMYIRDALNHGRYAEFNAYILPLIRIAHTIVVFLFHFSNKEEAEIGTGT